MRFLVADGNPSQGRALGATLVRLGHDAVVITDGGEVPESMNVRDIDAVLAAIESPTIGGLELAREIGHRAPSLPLGFITGETRDPKLLHRASLVGPVLPAHWTVRDLERLIAALSGRVALSWAEGTPQPRRRRRVNVSCSSWAKVARLCHGTARICVRGNHELRGGDRVRVSLALPDEIVVSVDARVLDARDDASYLELTGLQEVSENLLDLVRERSDD